MAYKFRSKCNAVLFLNVVLQLIDILSSLGQYLRLLRSIIAICIGSNDGMHFSIFILFSFLSLHLTPKWPPFYCSVLFCCQFSPFSLFLSSKFKQKRSRLNEERRPPLNANLDRVRKWRPINYSFVLMLIFSPASLACKTRKEFFLSNGARQENQPGEKERKLAKEESGHL